MVMGNRRRAQLEKVQHVVSETEHSRTMGQRQCEIGQDCDLDL